MTGKTYRCVLCDCTVRKLSEGGNGALMVLDGKTVIVHAPCKRLHEKRKRPR